MNRQGTQNRSRALGGRAFLVVWLVVLTCALAPAAALAQGSLNDPTNAQYSDHFNRIQRNIGSSGGGVGSGALPFTGADLPALIGLSAFLLSTGLLLRRLRGMPRADG